MCSTVGYLVLLLVSNVCLLEESLLFVLYAIDWVEHVASQAGS